MCGTGGVLTELSNKDLHAGKGGGSSVEGEILLDEPEVQPCQLPDVRLQERPLQGRHQRRQDPNNYSENETSTLSMSRWSSCLSRRRPCCSMSRTRTGWSQRRWHRTSLLVSDLSNSMLSRWPRIAPSETCSGKNTGGELVQRFAYISERVNLKRVSRMLNSLPPPLLTSHRENLKRVCKMLNSLPSGGPGGRAFGATGTKWSWGQAA